MNPETNEPRGLLDINPNAPKFQLTRYLPASDMAYFIQRYWIVEWDLRGNPPHAQETLTHPCVNLVFERGKTIIVGVETGTAIDVLVGSGHVFGVKFRPGGFYPFLNAALSTITNRKISFKSVFGIDGASLEDAILSAPDPETRISLFEDFLRPRLPAHDDNIEFVTQIADWIMTEPSITRVEQVGHQFHVTVRTLQRLFSQYVGASPKWVIKRYRLHEAAEQLNAGRKVDWHKLVFDLGYFDQAHFIKDFKTIIGRTPAEYARHQLNAS